jgi:hypothetical protein
MPRKDPYPYGYYLASVTVQVRDITATISLRHNDASYVEPGGDRGSWWECDDPAIARLLDIVSKAAENDIGTQGDPLYKLSRAVGLPIVSEERIAHTSRFPPEGDIL